MPVGRVLLVDDEADVRKAIRLALTKAGYEVVEAEDGEKGMQAIKSGDQPFMVDTIICDVYMPKVNGMEAISYFRSQFPSIPVIVITGQPDVQKATTLFRQGVVDYLVKPVEIAKLIEAVNRWKKADVLINDAAKM